MGEVLFIQLATEFKTVALEVTELSRKWDNFTTADKIKEVHNFTEILESSTEELHNLNNRLVLLRVESPELKDKPFFTAKAFDGVLLVVNGLRDKFMAVIKKELLTNQAMNVKIMDLEKMVQELAARLADGHNHSRSFIETKSMNYEAALQSNQNQNQQHDDSSQPKKSSIKAASFKQNESSPRPKRGGCRENTTEVSMESCIVRRKICTVGRSQHVKNILQPKFIQRFFDQPVEETVREEYVQKFYDETVRHENGGYVVRIPFKEDLSLGESRRHAMAIVRRMFEKLPPDLAKNYIQQCNEMRDNGYLKKPDPKFPAKNSIANFVIETKSLTTPLRMLMMCNQKTSNGLSVNDIQHTGPKLQKAMNMQIMNLRMFEFAITGDLSKMFWRILVDERDAAFQHTFVIFDESATLVEMMMPMMIFGNNSSPFLALATLNQLAKDVENRLPIAAKLLQTSFYVDDLMKSFRSKEEATKAFRQLKEALAFGNFKIQKCASNNDNTLLHIDNEDRLEAKIKEIECSDKEPDEVNVLGIKWNKQEDVLYYKVLPSTIDGPLTWRLALSFIAVHLFRIMIEDICEKVQKKIVAIVAVIFTA